MKSLTSTILAILVISLTLFGCSETSPQSTAQQFLDGLYHMDLAAAKKVSTTETIKQIDSYSERHQADYRDESQSLVIQVMEPEVHGNLATVKYKVSNDPSVRTLKLMKDNGKWLAQWSMMEFGGATMEDLQNGKPEDSAIQAQRPITDTIAKPLKDTTQ